MQNAHPKKDKQFVTAMKSFLAVIICLVLNCYSHNAVAADASARRAAEYEIKAAYLYNFLLFVEWPDNEARQADKEPSPNPDHEFITIGILGEDPFGDYFAKVEGKLITSMKKRLIIKRFGRFRNEHDFSKCQLLFISRSEKNRIRDILAGLKDIPVLTVADTPGFLENGGMINLLTIGGKIRWEINRTPVKRSELTISAQLLRNAVRVVEIPPDRHTAPPPKNSDQNPAGLAETNKGEQD